MYVAPATKVLTVLHIPDIGDGGGEPRTRCGLPMEPGDMWLPVRRDAEPVCGACQGITEDQEQGALL